MILSSIFLNQFIFANFLEIGKAKILVRNYSRMLFQKNCFIDPFMITFWAKLKGGVASYGYSEDFEKDC